MAFIFYILSFIAVISTLLTIVQNNAVYSLLYLIVSFLSISGIFFSFGASFAGALEVIIYAGAIMVLFIFVIMMLNLGNKDDIYEKKYLKPYFWIGPSILSFTLFCLMTYALFSLKESKIYYFLIDAKAIGISLFGSYILLIELSSILLLSTLVVVFHIGTKKNCNEN